MHIYAFTIVSIFQAIFLYVSQVFKDGSMVVIVCRRETGQPTKCYSCNVDPEFKERNKSISDILRETLPTNAHYVS